MNLSVPQNGGSLPALLPRPYFILPILNAVNSGRRSHPRVPCYPLERFAPPSARLLRPTDRRRMPGDRWTCVYFFHTCISLNIYFFRYFFDVSLGGCNNFQIFFPWCGRPWLCIIQPPRCGLISREIEDTCNSTTNGLWKVVMNNRWRGDESWYLYFNWNRFVTRGTSRDVESTETSSAQLTIFHWGRSIMTR